MKKIFSIFIIFNLFIGCSFIESKSFYQTFINPNFDIEINDDKNNIEFFFKVIINKSKFFCL